MRKRAFTLLVFLAAGGTACLALIAFSLWAGFGLPCIFYAVTGFSCPGCGTWRMLLALLKWDFSSAFSYNPALFLALPALFFLFAGMAWRYVKAGRRDLSRWQTTLCVALVVYFIVFGIGRNLF